MANTASSSAVSADKQARPTRVSTQNTPISAAKKTTQKSHPIDFLAEDNYTIASTKSHREIVNYVDSDGQTVKTQYVSNPITSVVVHDNVKNVDTNYFSRTETSTTVDPNTGHVAGNWVGEDSSYFVALNIPAIPGYAVVSTDAPSSSKLQIATQTITPSDGDLTFNVTYVKKFTIKSVKTVNEFVNYVDENGKVVAPQAKATPVTYLTVHNNLNNTDQVYYSTTETTATLDPNFGNPTGSDWIQGETGFNTIFNPTVTGYHFVSNNAPSSAGQTYIYEQASVDSDSTYTVVYAPDYTLDGDLKTISQTINYVDGAGTVVAPQATNKIMYTTVHDNVNNVDDHFYSTTATAAPTSVDLTTGRLGGDWNGGSTVFAEVVNPTVTGYHVVSNDAPDSDITAVREQPVTSDSPDATYTVVYAKDAATSTGTDTGTTPQRYIVSSTTGATSAFQYISYKDNNGNTLAPMHESFVTVATVHDNTGATQDILYYSSSDKASADTLTINQTTGVPEGSWSTTPIGFAAVPDPVIAGYHVISSNAPGSDLTQVAAQDTVTFDPLNTGSNGEEYLVTYAPNYTVKSTQTMNETINYTNENHQTVAVTYNATPIQVAVVENTQTGEDVSYYSTTETTPTLDLVTGQPTGTAWQTTGTFAAVKNPAVDGYHGLVMMHLALI